MSESKKMTYSKGNPVLAFILALIVGLSFLGIGFGIKISRDTKAKNYETVTGVIVDVDVQTNKKNSGTTSAVYEYIVDGKTYSYTSSMGSDMEIEIGSEAEIKYNPENPAEAFADDRTDNYYILFMVFGGAFLLIGFVILVNDILKVNVATRNNINGILFSLFFMGVPATGFIMKMKMNPIARFLSGIVILLGAIMFIGTLFGIFTGRKKTEEDEEKENEMFSNVIGKANEFIGENDIHGKYNKTRSTLGTIKLVIGAIALIGTVAYVASFAISNKQLNTALDGKTTLSDSYLTKVLGYSEDTMPEYLVFEREVVDISGDCYYFEATPGLPPTTISTDEFAVGDHVYWVEMYGGNTAVCSMEKFAYEGSRIPENSDRYDESGKCILNEEFVEHYFNSELKESATIKYIGADSTILEFEDDNGRLYRLQIDPMQKRYFLQAQKGDVYYWVGTDNGSYVFSEDMYVYDLEDTK